ncbi:MAG: RraA family protein [Terriglobales bacterium]
MNWEDICERYQRLYTGAVSDILDEMGLRNQALPRDIRPLASDMKVAGVAFTVQGRAAVTPEECARDYLPHALAIIDELTPFSVVVTEAGRDTECAHWGELSSNAARARGCLGVVIDGGTRDTDFICQIKFPVFARYATMVDAVGRWVPSSHQEPIRIGRVGIEAGDFIFGDRDGVLVIPAQFITEVLKQAEEVRSVENRVRRDLRRGRLVVDTFKQYGRM